MTPVSFEHALAAYEHWRLTLASYSHRTWAGEKPGLLAFCDLMGERGVPAVAALSAEDTDTWWESTEYLAASTRVTRLAQLRSFLHYCVKRDWLAADPTVLLRAKPSVNAPRRRLSAEQLLTLPEHADNPRDRVTVALAAQLAVRGGEITRMRIRDLDLAGGTLRVHVDKTGEIDDMPITAELDAELRRWLALYRVAAAGPLGPGSYLVPSRYFDNRQQRSIYRHVSAYTEPHRAVKAALERIGWTDTNREGVHTVRRSAARAFFDHAAARKNGADALIATMRLLHHARPEQTVAYIGLERATEARDELLRGRSFLRPAVATVRKAG